MNPAEGTQIGGNIEILVFHIQMVGFGRVQPPSVHTQVEDVLLQFGPVDVAGYRVEGVVRLHAGLGWPRLKVEQGLQTVHALVHLCPGAERGPYGNHDVCVLTVHVVNHLLRTLDARFGVAGVLVLVIGQETHELRVTHPVDVARILEGHRVPVLVAAPVLPVLDDAVQRHTQGAVFVHHFTELVGALVAFAALPEAQCPERIERGLPRQLSDSGNHAVGMAAIDEVIVGTVTHFRVERCLLRIVGKGGRRVVVPIQSVPLDGVDEGDADVHVLVAEEQLLAALVHLACLLLPQAVDDLILIQQEGLPHVERGGAGIVKVGKLCAIVLVLQQLLAGCVKEAYAAGGGVEGHQQAVGLHPYHSVLFIHLYGCL